MGCKCGWGGSMILVMQAIYPKVQHNVNKNAAAKLKLKLVRKSPAAMECINALFQLLQYALLRGKVVQMIQGRQSL